MSAKSLIHYHAPNTRSSSVRWLFEELGSPPHELKVLNFKKNEHKAAAFLAVNPMGKVPTIVHDDIVITETGAIAIYLADLFPEAGLAPKIGDTARGSYLRWIVFYHAAVEPAVCDYALKREPGSASMLPYGTYDSMVETLSGALSKGPYILGDRFSATDIVLGSGMRWLLLFKMLPDRPEFTSYAARLSERPALKRAMANDEALAGRLSA